MNFLQFSPQPCLTRLVRCYWIAEGNEIVPNRIIPDGCPELIFHFGDAYTREDEHGYTIQPLVIAAGQLTKPISIRPTGASGVLGIKFHPSGFWKLFGCNMDALTNKTISFDDVTESGTKQLTEELRDAVSHAQRIAIIEKFLLQRMGETRSSRVDAVLERIVKTNGQISVRQLSMDEKIPVRSLERYFHEQVGVAPKVYIRLMRFNHVFKLIQREVTKAEASYLSGYFDQSHFNRDFKNFSGDDPRTYFMDRHPFSEFFMSR